jgi:hypothetical protein
MRRRHVRIALLVTALVATSIPACRRTLFDITTNERVVRVPRSAKSEFVLDTRIELPSTLGVDKTVDSTTLNLTSTNLNTTNPVHVDLSIADAETPGLFRPVTSYDLDAGETREIRVVQTEPDDALVRATQTLAVIVRFDSTSPAPGIGELEFRFTLRVLAHKDTPGTGAGTLLFY